MWYFGVLLHQPLNESQTNEFIWGIQNQKSIYLPSDFESIFNLDKTENRYKFSTLNKPTYAYTNPGETKGLYVVSGRYRCGFQFNAVVSAAWLLGRYDSRVSLQLDIETKLVKEYKGNLRFP